MSRDYALIGLIVLAFALWYFAFQTDVWNFWVRLSLAAALLATIALIMTPDRWELFRARPRDIAIGIASALLLYAIFWVGKQLALAILPFAADQIQSVYAKRGQLDLLSIGLLLFFLLGPSEEIFWRGFVQRRLSQKGYRMLKHPAYPDGSPSRGLALAEPADLSAGDAGGLGLGERSAWLVTTALYALVHIWTLNLLLLVAAGVAGLLWGWLYQREQNLITVIVSHALWDVSIFVLFPLL
jgi:membrane protease YdiL (CAAX protease family)